MDQHNLILVTAITPTKSGNRKDYGFDRSGFRAE